MIKVKSKIPIKDKRGNIKPGDIGKVNSFPADNKELVPVWFNKHHKEFHWYPCWVEMRDLEIVK